MALAEIDHNDSPYYKRPIADSSLALPESFQKLECHKDGSIRVRSNNLETGLIKLPHQNKLFIEYTNRLGAMDMSPHGKYTLHCTHDNCSSKILVKKTGNETLDFSTYKPNKDADLLKKMPEDFKRKCDFDNSGDYLVCFNDKKQTLVWDIESEKIILKSDKDLDAIYIFPNKKKILAQSKAKLVVYKFDSDKPLISVEASEHMEPRPLNSESDFLYRTDSEFRQFNIDTLSSEKLGEVNVNIINEDFGMPNIQINGNFALYYDPNSRKMIWKDLISKYNFQIKQFENILGNPKNYCLVGKNKIAWIENDQNSKPKLHVMDLNKFFDIKKEKLPTFEDTWKKLGGFQNTPEYLHLLNHPEWKLLVQEKIKTEKKDPTQYNEAKVKILFAKIGDAKFKTRVEGNEEFEEIIGALSISELNKIKTLSKTELKNTQQKITWRDFLLPKIEHRIEYNLPNSFEIKMQRAQEFLDLHKDEQLPNYNFTALVNPEVQFPSKEHVASEPMPKPGELK